MPRAHNPLLNRYSKKHVLNDLNITNDVTPALKRPAVNLKILQEEVKKLTLADFGGYEEQLLEATRLAFHLKYFNIHEKLGVVPPRGILLHGPPGTGKTTFARALAGELDIPLYYISATELIGGISGESEKRIREIFKELIPNAPAILLLNDVDIIAAKRENAQKEMERRIVTQLIASLDELDGSPVLVIGTTNRVEVLDASLRRAGRFDREIALGIPDERCRFKILEIVTREMKLDTNVSLLTLARLTPGYVGADLRAFVQEASLCAVNRILEKSVTNSESSTLKFYSNENKNEICQELHQLLNWMKSTKTIEMEELENLNVEMKDFHKALQIILPSAKREGFATVPNVTWADIGALKEVRSELEWTILNPIQQPENFEVFGAVPKAQGVLLCGPPGCGKTLLAKAVANETGMNFISVKGPELLCMYVGESERAVRTVFQRARDSSPCVIFFDEIDALCPKRSNTETTGSARLVNQLLTEMDGMETRKLVFLIGATNRPDMVDPAILRPGRFDKILFINFPNVYERADILKKATKNGQNPRISSSVDFNQIASKCNYFTGADLVALVNEARIIALRQRFEENNTEINAINSRHFELAIEKVIPSVNEDDRKRYERLKTLYSK